MQVKEIEGKGRGVVAARSFYRGEFIVEYAGDLIEILIARERESKYNLSSAFGCYMYYFKHNNKNYCIDATAETGRLGRLVNHSRMKPNCKTKVVMVKNVPRLILVATKTIKEGDEILYDYGDRSKESILAHPWLAL
uniref:SET domain-containing protein n=1 Tax=Helobdella robusta TaxID=6412 RepID=T1G895_HELRO